MSCTEELNINYIDFNNKISDSFKKLTSISIEINTLENELSLYKNSINKQLSEFISVEKKYIDDHLVNLLNNLNIKFEEAEVQINNQIEKIENTSKSFNDFISDETSIKLTNNFKEKSESERKWYYGFNMVSGIAIIFAICMSYFSLTEFADNHAKNFTQLDLYYLGIRLLFSFLIFSTVAFTNKLANKHYYHWKKNESTYLKLTALNSFIANMSPEKQQEIHEKLIDVYFGKEDLDPTIYKKYDNTSENILKLFADKLPSIGAETKKGN
ncbi:hypothetical protein [Acinetobacter sp. SH20PTE14]|uniref:hypothetical protein n=1 Tax=Acinetobacter sp. SH20PTE14 TaxID=2905879 RepID=UPI001F39403D|nr:hypothetical protein [Acinetobacter sp. SH20PTE14]UIJ77056.1 hypothetical protein LXF01_07360 [Acinetobacter sp. SH20PTE14]